jgi:hypothetical protein
MTQDGIGITISSREVEICFSIKNAIMRNDDDMVTCMKCYDEWNIVQWKCSIKEQHNDNVCNEFGVILMLKVILM